MMFDIVVHFDRDKLLLQKEHILAAVCPQLSQKFRVVFLCERPGVLEETLPGLLSSFHPLAPFSTSFDAASNA